MSHFLPRRRLFDETQTGIKNKKEVSWAYFFSISAQFCKLLLAVNFVRYSQLLATFGAAACQYSATVLGSHSLTETVLVVAATVVGLECSFHFLIFVIIVCST